MWYDAWVPSTLLLALSLSVSQGIAIAGALCHLCVPLWEMRLLQCCSHR